ncbi:MAG: LamG domain-containing protein [Byssovorax sp.]
MKLLLHVENSAVDVIGNPVNNSGVTFSGPAARFGSYGAVFNGNAYLSVGASGVFAIGLSDFTVEAWVQSNTNAADTYYRRIFMTDGPTGNAAGNFQIAIVPSTGRVNLWDGATLDLIGTSNVTDGLWHHVAATRQQGTLRLFVDGALQGSIAYNVSITPVASPRPWIGAYTASWGRFVGNMDDVRVTVGVARYTAAFTPPSAQFPDH